MAAAAAGIFSHSLTAAHAAAIAAPAASSSTGTSSSSDSSDAGDSSATISANDFLTLLVTEMQNQDPTADTDPNEYINQLVSVNSLEQLIDINQNLSTALGDSSTSDTASPQTTGAATSDSGAGSSSATGRARAAAHPVVASTASPSATSSSGASGNNSQTPAATQLAPGNLSVPDATPAALRVAQSLSGRTGSSAQVNRLTGAR